MDSGRVALDAGGQVLEVAVAPVLVSHLVVEQVHVRRASLLLDQLDDLGVIPGDEISYKSSVEVSVPANGKCHQTNLWQ